MYGLAYKI